MDTIKIGKYEIPKKKAILAIFLILVLLVAVLKWKDLYCLYLLLANPANYEAVCAIVG